MARTNRKEQYKELKKDRENKRKTKKEERAKRKKSLKDRLLLLTQEKIDSPEEIK